MSLPEEQRVRNPQTILVVEDDPMQQVILSKTLSTHGYEVVLTENGRTGLEKVRSIRPRVLITDWMMPEMDGSELCRRIKQDSELRYTYVIILTAKEGSEAKLQGFDSGADDYLVKPFQFDELLARVRVGFRIRSLQEELAVLQHQLAIVELARTMGHEINNPLAILKGYLELAEIHLKKNPDETLQRQLALIKSAADKIQLVVERLQHIRKPANTEYIRGMNMVDLWEIEKGEEDK
jgi:DNA-binding response OmpR family regulator